MNPLARAHLANIQNLCIFLAAAIAFGYREPVRVRTNHIYAFPGSSLSLRTIIELSNSAIAEFSRSYRIPDQIINSIVPEECTIQVLCELLIYSAAPNNVRYHYLKALASKITVSLTPRAYYYMYIFRSESRLHPDGGINHTYWDPSFFLPQKSQHLYAYSPFYSLSFGHPSFVLDNIYSSQRLSSSKPIRLFEPIPESRAYQGVGSLRDILNPSVANNFLITSLELEFNLECSQAFELLSGNHFSHVRSLQLLHSVTQEVNYSVYSALPEENPSYSGTIRYVRENPIFSTFQPLSSVVSRFILESTTIVVIHTRDSTYSYSSGIRDSNFHNYIEAVNWLLSQGHSVVRISMDSTQHQFVHPRFLDLSRLHLSSGLIDQLSILQNAYAFIGTSSGISHWATHFGLPLLILNASAYPSCTLTNSAVHSGKNIGFERSGHLTPSLLVFLDALKSTFSAYHQKYYRLYELSSKQILDEIKCFMHSIEHPSDTPLTLYHVLSKHQIDTSSFPDIYISRLFGQRIDLALSQLIGHSPPCL